MPRSSGEGKEQGASGPKILTPSSRASVAPDLLTTTLSSRSRKGSLCRFLQAFHHSLTFPLAEAPGPTLQSTKTPSSFGAAHERAQRGALPGLRVRAVPWMLSALWGPRSPYNVRLYRVPGRRSRSTAERRVPGTISSRCSRGRRWGSRVLGDGTPKRSRKESKAPDGASQLSRSELVVTSVTDSWDRRGPGSPEA